MSTSLSPDKEVFISYCHDDNDELIGDQWVEQFHKYLATRLKQILGRGNEPGIWRDKKLQPNQDFAAVLVDELNTAAILISILTPSYVGSEWCQREIDEFVRAAERKGGLEIGDHQKRIFKVEKTQVPREQHPPALQGQTGFPFYVLDKEKGYPSELSLSPDDPKKNALALERLNDLAYSIKATLEAFRSMHGIAEATQVSSSPTDNKQPPIYLAETSFDLSEEQMSVRRELESQGYRVLPEGDLPVRQPDEFKNAVLDALDQCELSLHMIGANRPPVPAGESDDVVVLQNRLAAEKGAASGLERLIWLPEGLSSADEIQQQFINKLQRDPEAQGNADVLQVPLQDLITTIHDSLEKITAAKKQQVSASNASTEARPKRIYVCYAREDEEAVSPLIDYLSEKGFEVLDPLLDDNAKDDEVVKVHKINMKDCDAALLFTDQGGQFWLKTQMSEFRKAPHYRNNKAMLAYAIFLGPGMRSVKIRTQDMLLNGDEKFAPETLAPFISKLGASSENQP